MCPVIKLLNNRYWHKNHILYTDNWYTSIPLLQYVLQKGVHLVDTIRTNKKNIPKDAIFKEKGENKKQRGYMLQMQCNIDNHMVYFVSWMANKPVHLLSSLRSYKTDCKRTIFITEKKKNKTLC